MISPKEEDDGQKEEETENEVEKEKEKLVEQKNLKDEQSDTNVKYLTDKKTVM